MSQEMPVGIIPAILGVIFVEEHPFLTFLMENIAKYKEYINDSNVIIITDVANLKG